MTCNEIQTQLKTFTDGELKGREALRIQQHLASCASCRTEYESIERLHATLRANDIIPADAMPQTAPSPNTVRLPDAARSRRRQLISAGFAAAAALLIAIVALTPAIRPTKSFAAEVGDALARTNTWHLSGWRQIGGKRIPWEIWGRRKPFLYYESVGNDAIYDDGNLQTRIYAPHQGLASGLVVYSNSNGGKFNNSYAEPAWDEIINPSYWQPGMNMGYLTKIQDEGDFAVFRKQYPLGVTFGVNSNELFTIDKRSRLPVRYQLRLDNGKDKWYTEDMSAQYDVTLPPEALKPSPPSGYQDVDLRPQPRRQPAQPASSAELSIGLTIDTHTLAVTKDGTILIGAKATPNSSRLSLPPNGPFYFTVDPPDTVDVTGTGPDGERVIRYLNDFGNTSSPGGIVMFSQVDDAPPPGWKPRSITVPLTATVGINVPQTDMMDVHGTPIIFGTSGTQITQETKTIRLTFAAGDNVASLEPFLANSFGSYRYKTLDALTVQIAEAHASYWWSVPDNPMDLSTWPERIQSLAKKDPHNAEVVAYEEKGQRLFNKARDRSYGKAAEWQMRAVDAMPKHGNLAFARILKMGTAALYYRQAGQEDLARGVWKRMLTEGQHIPGMEPQMSKARLGLAGKKLPEEQ